MALFRIYQDLFALRRNNLRLLVDGEITWLVTDDARDEALTRSS